MLGDDGAEEFELGSLECPLREKVGVVGEGYSDMMEERERWFPRGVELGESIVTSPPSLPRASTNCGSMSGFNSRPRIVSPCIPSWVVPSRRRAREPLCWVVGYALVPWFLVRW